MASVNSPFSLEAVLFLINVGSKWNCLWHFHNLRSVRKNYQTSFCIRVHKLPSRLIWLSSMNKVYRWQECMTEKYAVVHSSWNMFPLITGMHHSNVLEMEIREGNKRS